MEDILLTLLISAYAITGIVDIIAYWPTIKDLYYYKKPSANFRSYFIWAITSFIAFMYSLFILQDLLFRIVSGMFFSANLCVLFLILRLKF